MSTPEVPTPPADWTDTAKKWLLRAGWLLAVLLGVLTAYLTYRDTGRVDIPDVPPFPGESGNVVKSGTGDVYAMGWVDDPDARAASFARFPVVQFADTPAGQAKMGTDKDTFLWRAVRKASGRKENDPWYPSVNQRDVGCCVGCGWKHGVDVLSAVQIVMGGRAEEWRPVSVEAIYGMSRVEYGKARLNGDGSVGAWAREAVRQGGVAEMKKYASADLTTFSPQRARQFGAQGVPQDIEDAARGQLVRGTAHVRTWEDISKAVQQGYPIAVCSNVGFNDFNGSTGTRDAAGYIRPRGTWNHCMMFCGVRFGDRPGVFCLNSWGDTAHNGPRWPEDAPPAGFWIDAEVAGRMAAQGDTFALADLAGFPARPLNWEVRAEPRRNVPQFRPAALFALAF